MTKHDYKQHAYYMIYLIRCVLHDQIPKKEKLDKIDLSKLYEVAEKHSLTAITAYALESAGVVDEKFTQAKAKAIRKNILLDVEREKVLSELEKAGIWYMPLKGIILKEYYPKIGMRQMADNDFLFDKTRQNDIRNIMLSCGFRVESFDKSKHDVYFKKPVSNFQMHVSLFEIDSKSVMYNYFKDIDKRLVSDNNSCFGRTFTDEDYYIYIKAHEYNHYSSSGTGLRNLVDTYIYIKRFGNNLNWKYLSTKFAKLGMTDYEKGTQTLSLDLFDGRRLSDSDKKLLDYFIFSGTYGNTKNKISNSIAKKQGSKARYVFDRIFLPRKAIEKQYPFFYEHKLLLPTLPFYRLFRGLRHNKARIIIELKTLIKL
ncbi:Uncharacterised nucleotidyltransferase [Ruminococcaceae bacterium FB2012]|nr:Uncharacterised nucleotidyltransferase [Ruminococcaceae bacterium FB2012]